MDVLNCQRIAIASDNYLGVWKKVARSRTMWFSSARCILCYICLYSDRAYSCRPHHSSLISLKLIPSRPVSHSLYRPSSCHEDEEQDDDYKDDNRQHQQGTYSIMFLALYTYIISNWNSSFTHALAVLQVIL